MSDPTMPPYEPSAYVSKPHSRTLCDRCSEPTPATEVVTCDYGCCHDQCGECAAFTRREAV